MYKQLLLPMVTALLLAGLAGCAFKPTMATQQYHRAMENHEAEKAAGLQCIRKHVMTPVGRRVIAVFFPVDPLPNKDRKLADPDVVTAAQAGDLSELVRLTRPCRSRFVRAASFIGDDAVSLETARMAENDIDIAAVIRQDITIGEFNARFLRRDEAFRADMAAAKDAAYDRYRARHEAELGRRASSAQ